MREFDLEAFLPRFLKAFGETLLMVGASFGIAAVLGVLIALWLYASRPGNILENRVVYAALNLVINIVRPVPFIIVAIAVVARALLAEHGGIPFRCGHAGASGQHGNGGDAGAMTESVHAATIAGAPRGRIVPSYDAPMRRRDAIRRRGLLAYAALMQRSTDTPP